MTFKTNNNEPIPKKLRTQKLLAMSNDFVFKRVMDDVPSFVKLLIRLDPDLKHLKNIQLLPQKTEMLGYNSDVKTYVLDYFTLYTGEIIDKHGVAVSITGFCNFEMQKIILPDLPDRASGYAMRIFSNLIEKGLPEFERMPINSIIFCDGSTDHLEAYKGEKDRWHHTAAIRSGAQPRLRISKKFNLNFIETKKFDKLCTLADTDDVEKWAALTFLARSESLSEEERVFIWNLGGAMREGLKRLGELSDLEMFARLSKERNEWYKKLDDEIILENKKIISKATAKATAEGIAKGVAKGKAEERAAVARRMLSNGLDVNVIAISTGLTPEEVTKLANSTAQ